jgi:hypothetical protein
MRSPNASVPLSLPVQPLADFNFIVAVIPPPAEAISAFHSESEGTCQPDGQIPRCCDGAFSGTDWKESFTPMASDHVYMRP